MRHHPYAIVLALSLPVFAFGLMSQPHETLATGFLGLGVLSWLGFILAIPLRLLKAHIHGAKAVNSSDETIQSIYLLGAGCFSLAGLFAGDIERAILTFGVLGGILLAAHLVQLLWHYL